LSGSLPTEHGDTATPKLRFKKHFKYEMDTVKLESYNDGDDDDDDDDDDNDNNNNKLIKR
jgi:hypothetical protein